MDHMLAMALFIAMLVEFLLVQRAGTSTFFLLMMITLVDVLAGFIVSIRSSQRQVEIEGPGKRCDLTATASRETPIGSERARQGAARTVSAIGRAHR